MQRSLQLPRLRQVAHMQSATCRNLYLSNRAFKSRIAFTVGFLASRSSKLDSMLIDFDNFFLRKKGTKKPKTSRLQGDDCGSKALVRKGTCTKTSWLSLTRSAMTPLIQSYTNHTRKSVRSRSRTHGKISQHNSRHKLK